MFFFVAVGIATADDEDRLSSDERAVVADLIRRGMPELLEPILAGRSPVHRIHYARACRVAAEQETDASARDRLVKTAEETYEKLIEYAKSQIEKGDEKDQFRLAEWSVEFGDLMLRDVAGAYLDRYELTCGLDYNQEEALRVLNRAADAYWDAGKIIEEMRMKARVVESDVYLLTGLAGKIEPLSERQRLNAAWCSIYLAMLSPDGAVQRDGWIADALTQFDVTVGDPTSAAIKYNALLGLGLALRENRRYDDANDKFDKVSRSTQPQGLTLRAQYEKAKSLWTESRYRQARDTLQELAKTPANNETVFYVRLADLAHAYTYIHEANRPRTTKERQTQLKQEAESLLVDLAKRGGPWPELTKPFLSRISGVKRDLKDLNDLELAMAASRMMEADDFGRAIEAWRLLLDRPSSKKEAHRARFNLAVCLYQSGKLRESAEIFLEEAKRPASEVEVEKVYEYAYASWKQIAADTSDSKDFLELADAAKLLVVRQPEYPKKQDVEWVAALALEEAGRYESATTAYESIPLSSPYHVEARRNAARCKQLVFEAMPESASAIQRNRMARSASEAWLTFAEYCKKLLDGNTTGNIDRAQVQSWRTEALIAAAQHLAGEDIKDFDEALTVLKDVPRDARALGLRIRCLQALGKSADARKALQDFVEGGVDANLGAVLIKMSADMQAEIDKLGRYGRDDEARRLADQTIPTLQYLIQWLQQNPEHAKHVPLARIAMVDTLLYAERYDEASELLDKMIAENPKSGSYLRRAAQLRERMSQRETAAKKTKLEDEAEALWLRLLEDQNLRESAPAVYWEARYFWLKHQLRHGNAEEVLKGIQTEQAWYPDLGGPPWQGRLLELKARASRMAALDG